MTHIQFHIHYHTIWGQALYICGSIPELGNFDEGKAMRLEYIEENHQWAAIIDTDFALSFEYYYIVKEGSRVVRREWGDNRTLTTKRDTKFSIHDHWKEVPYHQYLYSSVFSGSIFARKMNNYSTNYFPKSIVLNVRCPFVEKNQMLMLTGEGDVLGNWDIEKALVLRFLRVGEWQIVLRMNDFFGQTAYKFVIVDSASKQVLHWESGENRLLKIDKSDKTRNRVQVEMAIPYRYPEYIRKGAGVAIPVFSLRSETSFGIGDFQDLKKMVDWAVRTNQQVIQLLPINDTTATFTWKDSYPYSTISIYALHPIYLGMSRFLLKNNTLQKKYANEAKKLNALPEVDYETVLRLKLDYLYTFFLEVGKVTLQTDAYKQFFQHNQSWLIPYAAYCYFRDTYQTAKFSDWGDDALYNQAHIHQLIENDKKVNTTTNFYCFVQYLLHTQLSDVARYAHEKGVALKGDIPIGINRDSVDAWTHPHLFNMDTQTGAPPDDFSFFGQNWGFPTYNWRAMAEENYAWWKNRFRKMADYFDAYRIDHILGFFRIWEIPLDAVQGILGHFSPALPYWKEELIYLGIPFDETRMADPFIHECFLHEYFGEYTDEVRNKYLDVIGWKRFKLKPFCGTQQKINTFFHDKTDEKSLRIRDGLYGLCAEVLFVRDREDHYRFHPRITAQYTFSYRYLDDAAKAAFNRLYDDFFYHRHNYFWRDKAMEKLPELIASTNMMVCGEDLGMVPDCVLSVMSQLRILSLEIQRMPKETQRVFSDLNRLPYLSVCTTSTHDMSPIRAWWREDRETTQRFYNEVLQLHGEAPGSCTPELCELILKKHLESTAMWVILPWQDWVAIDEKARRKNPEEERINLPSNPDNYWRYRMHLTIEQLMKKTSLNNRIRKLAMRK